MIFLDSLIHSLRGFQLSIKPLQKNLTEMSLCTFIPLILWNQCFKDDFVRFQTYLPLPPPKRDFLTQSIACTTAWLPFSSQFWHFWLIGVLLPWLWQVCLLLNWQFVRYSNIYFSHTPSQKLELQSQKLKVKNNGHSCAKS